MFGYIRPLKAEMKVREFERFRACYCALCHALGEEYGLFSRMFLNYDFVFLAMLLWDEGDNPEYLGRRCIASPCSKKVCCKINSTLKQCAGYSVILTYWKLKDSIRDEKFTKRLLSWVCALLLRRAYKKAARLHKNFDGSVRSLLGELTALEEASEPSIDKTADKFAQLLSSASAGTENAGKRRVLEQLLYHTGRWIYILDAVNDLKEDCEACRYNPVAARYAVVDGLLSEEVRTELEVTIRHSQNDIAAAFELLPKTIWRSVAGNIIYLGMPDVSARAFNGKLEDIDRIFPRNRNIRRNI